MTIEDLAREAGVSPDTLGDFEAGTRTPRELTISKVLSALDRIEDEVGKNVPTLPAEQEAGIESPGDAAASGGTIEIEVDGPRIVVRGPASDAEALVDIVTRLKDRDLAATGMEVAP